MDYMIIVPNAVFATPDDAEAVQAFLDNLSGGEAVAAITASGMTWNLACKVVNPKVQKARDLLRQAQVELNKFVPADHPLTEEIEDYLKGRKT